MGRFAITVGVLLTSMTDVAAQITISGSGFEVAAEAAILMDGPGKYCHAISPAASDSWCDLNCHATPSNCPPALCQCSDTPPAPGPTPSPTPPPAPWPPAHGPDVGCTPVQKAAGCLTCSDSALCNTCKEGYVLDMVTCSPNAGGIVGCESLANTTLLGAAKCAKCGSNYYGADCTPWYKVEGPKLVQFYDYRASDNESYPFGNCDGASAMGVIGYLHHEVVGLVEPSKDGSWIPVRKFGIDRIHRFLITMKNPPPVFESKKGQFGPWNPFDSAACSSTDPSGDDAGCRKRWEQYGYNVGCLNHPFNVNAPGEQYYDFPAACPLKNFTDKDAQCTTDYPGGQCIRPDGRRECTYSVEDAGYVMLEDVEGIPDTQWKTWENFQKARVCEFNKDGSCAAHQLVGSGLPFWDNMFSWIDQKKRATALMETFRKKYPNSSYIEDPTCDW